LRERRSQIVNEYIQLLAAHSRQDRYSLDAERKRLNHLSLPEVREKLAALKLRQQMSADSVPALKKVVAEARPVYGYPEMPREIYQDGKLIKLDFHPID